jgi:ABC-type multidrug transport system fused ATPase/permease subunit
VQFLKYSNLLHVVTPHRRTLALILLLLLTDSAAALAGPWMAGLLTKTLLLGEESGLPGFPVILMAWFGLLVVKSVLGFSSSYLVGSTGADMASLLRSRVYDHLQVLPTPYYQDRKPGDLLTLLSSWFSSCRFWPRSSALS